MQREVRQQAVVGPGGRIEVVAPELPEGAEAEVVVRLIAAAPPANGSGSRPPERPVDGFTEVVQWYHHDEWRGKVRGTGLEVWEVIDQYLALGRDFGALLLGFPHLSLDQLRAAVAYAGIYSDEIAGMLQRQYRATPAGVRPVASPQWP